MAIELNTIGNEAIRTGGEPINKPTHPPLGKVLAWTVTQKEDGTGELTIDLADGGRLREWAAHLANLWADGPDQ